MIPFPDKKYKIIYADPPWEYGSFTNEGDNRVPKRLGISRKFAITPYPLMPLSKLKELPVSGISDKDSVLLLWCTFPTLPDAFELITHWGFKYRTNAFTWVKRNKSGIGYFKGLGNYTRANSEICLLAKKGKGCKVVDKTISQICDAPLKNHSVKPHIIRTRIEKLFGNLPRIELFARTKIHGWDTWGNDEKLQSAPLESFFITPDQR